MKNKIEEILKKLDNSFYMMFEENKKETSINFTESELLFIYGLIETILKASEPLKQN